MSIATHLRKPVRALSLALATGLLGGCFSGEDTPELLIYADKQLAGPLNEVVNRYREALEDGLPYEIRIVSGDSVELAARINGEELPEVAPADQAPAEDDAEESDETPTPIERADLFLPLHDTDLGKVGELAGRSQQVGELIPTVVVHDTWEKGIESFDDLNGPGIRLAIGDKNKLAIGLAAEAVIDQSRDPRTLRRHVIYRTDTADDLVHLLKAGWVDAAIIWKYALKPLDTAKFVEMPLPEGLAGSHPIQVTELNDSEMPSEAANLADYLAGDESRAIFTRHGFGTVPSTVLSADEAVTGEHAAPAVDKDNS